MRLILFYIKIKIICHINVFSMSNIMKGGKFDDKIRDK